MRNTTEPSYKFGTDFQTITVLYPSAGSQLFQRGINEATQCSLGTHVHRPEEYLCLLSCEEWLPPLISIRSRSVASSDTSSALIWSRITASGKRDYVDGPVRLQLR